MYEKASFHIHTSSDMALVLSLALNLVLAGITAYSMAPEQAKLTSSIAEISAYLHNAFELMNTYPCLALAFFVVVVLHPIGLVLLLFNSSCKTNVALVNKGCQTDATCETGVVSTICFRSQDENVTDDDSDADDSVADEVPETRITGGEEIKKVDMTDADLHKAFGDLALNDKGANGDKPVVITEVANKIRNDPDFRRTVGAFGVDIDDIDDDDLVKMLRFDGVEYEGVIENENTSIVESSGDDDEVVYLQAAVTLLKLEGSAWKKYEQLLLNLTTKCGKPCMVFRNKIGVVHFNLPIARGMKFERAETKTGSGYIRFMSIQEESQGLQAFMLHSGSKMLDKLMAVLENMAA